MIGAACFIVASTAHAGTLTAEGNVTALTSFDQMATLTGTAAFDEGPINSNVPLDLYAAQGLTWIEGDFQDNFPGIVSAGQATPPYYQSDAQFFPQPINNGGVQVMNYVYFGGVAKFSAIVTQVGLTAGRNGNQFLTAWDQQGQIIGQVDWVPANDASFIGIDTQGVPIGLIAYGNHNVFQGEAYNVGGATIMADTWVWSKGSCDTDAECADDDACNGPEACMAGECVAGEPLVCMDDNACTDDSCDAGIGCVFANNVVDCDDGSLCTEATVCAEGMCGGGEIVACEDDGLVCTAETCDADLGCTHDPIPGCCEDDADCLPEESCDLVDNVCIPNMPDTTTGETTTGETTGEATITEGSTGDDTGSTAGPDLTTGETGGSDTGGGPVTTTNETDTTTPTTGGPVSAGDTSTGDPADSEAATDTAGVDDGGCGCRSQGPGNDALGALASLGLGLLLRRRRR